MTNQEDEMRGPRPGDLPADTDWQDGRCDCRTRAEHDAMCFTTDRAKIRDSDEPDEIGTAYDPHATCRVDAPMRADLVAGGHAEPCECAPTTSPTPEQVARILDEHKWEQYGSCACGLDLQAPHGRQTAYWRAHLAQVLAGEIVLTSTDPAVHAAMLDALVRAGVLTKIETAMRAEPGGKAVIHRRLVSRWEVAP